MNSLFIRIASFKEMILCVNVSGRGSEKTKCLENETFRFLHPNNLAKFTLSVKTSPN